MGQRGTIAGLVIILVVVLGTVDWSIGASLPEKDSANQMDNLCKQLTMKKANLANIPPKDGRCYVLYNDCQENSDCCSGRCSNPFPGCFGADWCLPA